MRLLKQGLLFGFFSLFAVACSAADSSSAYTLGKQYRQVGEVQKPGEYQFRSGLNVLSAIAIAGGATYRANNSSVMIQRSGSNELKEYPQSPTVLVLPGDVVRVPERFF